MTTNHTQESVQSLMGVLFFAVLNQAMLGTIGVLQTFPLEMPIFLREHSSATYGVSPYFIGRTFAGGCECTYLIAYMSVCSNLCSY